MSEKCFYWLTKRPGMGDYIIEKFEPAQPEIVNGIPHDAFKRVSLLSKNYDELSDYFANSIMYPLVMEKENPNKISFDSAIISIEEMLKTKLLVGTKTIEIKFSELQRNVGSIQ